MTTRKTTTDAPGRKGASKSALDKKSAETAALILLAGGSSTRMGGLGKKEFLPLDGGTVLSRAAVSFIKTRLFSTVAVTYPAGSLSAAKKAFFASEECRHFTGNVVFVRGGKSRQESVLLALRSLKRHCRLKIPTTVLIHDGARPFVSERLALETLKAARECGAAVPALEPTETQKEIDGDHRIIRHLRRKTLAAVQTPQGFRFKEMLAFHEQAKKDSIECTDDTEIWDRYCEEKTRVIPGESGNLKITYPKDAADETRNAESENRIGLGYDVHRLEAGRDLVLGGVRIPFEKGELGHSDGDALLHAITDALLGASALGDIGSYFPDTDERWRGADSRKLLATAWKNARDAGWQLVNLDCVVKLQQPKFMPYREEVRKSIAYALEVEPERVFVKAKTAEGLGDVGRGEAVECQAICLLEREKRTTVHAHNNGTKRQ